MDDPPSGTTVTVDNVSKMPKAIMSGSGDCRGLAGAGLYMNDYFGNAFTLGFADSVTYSEDADETLLGEVFLEQELTGGRYKNVTFANTDGVIGEGDAPDLFKYSREMRIVGEHLYGKPSKQGTLGVKARVDSAKFGKEVMTNNATKCNVINDYYRGNNSRGVGGIGKNFTTWTGFASASDLKYVASGGINEWEDGDDIDLLDEYKIAIKTDVTASLSAGMQFLLDMTVDGVSGHRYTKVSSFEYHKPELATHCKVVLSPDIGTTVTLKNISSSGDFDNLLLSSDIESVQLSTGTTYNTLLYKNQLTIWVGTASVSSLPVSTSLTATHTSGTVNYFTVFTSEDGTDPFAGYTVITFADGLPITYKIDVINKES
jgi:hypothetical protein